MSLARGARLALAVSLLLVGACGSPAATPAPGAMTPTTGDPAALTIVAEDIAFEPASLRVPAGTPLDITFENRDDGVPHDLRLLGDAQFSTTLVESEILTGPSTQRVPVPGLLPGRYRFDCTVHPNMVVDLTVDG